MAGGQRRKGAVLATTHPAWEAAKAHRRNLDHDEAIRESVQLQNQFRTLWGDGMAPSPVDLIQILRTLTQRKIAFVLTGAHALGGWTGRPRSTQDVDILVKAGRNHARAVKALRELYPHLEVRSLPGVTAFFPPGEKESILDVAYPHRADLEETLHHPVWVENKTLGLRYRIPSLEAALANKYGAMISPSRDPRKRGQDALDFAWMVTHSLDEGQQPIDLKKLATYGEKVWAGGGGEEILRLVEQAQAGQLINIHEIEQSGGRKGK